MNGRTYALCAGLPSEANEGHVGGERWDPFRVQIVAQVNGRLRETAVVEEKQANALSAVHPASYTHTEIVNY